MRKSVEATDAITHASTHTQSPWPAGAADIYPQGIYNLRFRVKKLSFTIQFSILVSHGSPVSPTINLAQHLIFFMFSLYFFNKLAPHR
jgi:hypothetical protein